MSSRMLEDGVDVTLPQNTRGVADSRISVIDAFSLATKGGGEALKLPVGVIKEGYAFDVQVIDTRQKENPLPDFGVFTSPEARLQNPVLSNDAKYSPSLGPRKKVHENEENETVESTKNKHLTIGMNEDIPFGQAVLLGLQHVLAMDVYVPPFIIATAVAMSSSDASGLIQSTF